MVKKLFDNGAVLKPSKEHSGRFLALDTTSEIKTLLLHNGANPNYIGSGNVSLLSNAFFDIVSIKPSV